jgi:hypothetical protein
MRTKLPLIVIMFSTILLISMKISYNDWIIEKHKQYSLHFTAADKTNVKAYNQLIETGLNSVRSFFNPPLFKEFAIYVHPDRKSLDSTWQKDWNMPDFKSECWMVASGVSTRLDLISPILWDKESSEHKYADIIKTEQLITHELIHVYHGQLNVSPDFSSTDGIDWFVEGLATYASGQCDSSRMSEVKKAISENKIPAGLDKYWTGKIRYGLSGTVVMYIDNTYGRSKLIDLLPLNKKTDLLAELNTTESALLEGWRNFILK